MRTHARAYARTYARARTHVCTREHTRTRTHGTGGLQEGGVYSFASDMWAFGCVLYEMVRCRPVVGLGLP